MKSMTGFGRGQASADGLQVCVEAFSVNRKQAEVVVQCPRELAALEERIRRHALAKIERGRVQLTITIDRGDTPDSVFQIDTTLARALADAVDTLASSLGKPLALTATDLLRQPGVFCQTARECDPESAWATLATALDAALDGLIAMRTREGGDLRDDFINRLEALETITSKIAGLADGRPERYRESLARRLAEIRTTADGADDDRIAREVALFADRCCIDEEITRLASHFAKFRDYLSGPAACGRALDFLCQEIFREFNTIGSKAADAAVAHLVVEGKTELEKIREQVQNAE